MMFEVDIVPTDDELVSLIKSSLIFRFYTAHKMLECFSDDQISEAYDSRNLNNNYNYEEKYYNILDEEKEWNRHKDQLYLMAIDLKPNLEKIKEYIEKNLKF